MGGHSAIVVDIDPAKREAAKHAGAAAVIDGSARDAVAADHEAHQWAPAPGRRSIWSARRRARASAIDSLIKGGKYIIVGLFGGDFTVSLPPIPMRA